MKEALKELFPSGVFAESLGPQLWDQWQGGSVLQGKTTLFNTVETFLIFFFLINFFDLPLSCFWTTISTVEF